MRRFGFALVLLASWTILLLWAARIDVSSPFLAAEQRGFPGDDFAAVFGSASADSDRLRVTATGDDFTSLQSLHPSDIDADRFPTLRYRFAGFPHTLELSLVFRAADNPEDVAISLPWPGNAMRTFDLSQVPEWRGRIVEIGFAEFPTAQLVPPAQGFKPFDIVEAGLWSRSWRGDLAALTTDWFAAWPWSQRSVHALGRDTDTPRARSLVLCVAIAAGVAIVLALLAFGRRDRRFVSTAAVAVAVAWLALDVVWQTGLWGRMQTTRAVYGSLSWPQREDTVADTDIVAAADKLRAMLRDEPENSRILVYTGSGQTYELLRLIWHLLPRNAAVYANASGLGEALPDGCLLVFFNSDEWRTNPHMRHLLAHSEHLASSLSIHGDSFENDALVVFRFHHGR